MSTMHIEAYPHLVTSIGGTNARLVSETTPQVIEKAEVLPCKSYGTVVDAVKAYLERANSPKVLHTTFATVNPILDDRVWMTNHHWAFSIETTRQALGLEILILLNDFTAQTLTMTKTERRGLVQIGGQKPIKFAPKAIIGPGTGLGVGGLVHSAVGWVTLSGEGDHTSLPPLDDMEVLIWQYAKNKYGHVSAERFLSGVGLDLTYEALARHDDIRQYRLGSSEITNKTLSGASPLCRQILDIFCAILGTVAPSLALSLGACGGVYLCGGIIPRVLDYFKTSPFHSRFEDKGHFEAYLAAIPVYVILSKFPDIVGVAAALDNRLNSV